MTWNSWTVKTYLFFDNIILQRNNETYGHLFQGKKIELTVEEMKNISKYLKKAWNWELKSYSFHGKYISSSEFCLKKANESINISKDCSIVFDPYSKSLRITKNDVIFDSCKSDSDYIRKYGDE